MKNKISNAIHAFIGQFAMKKMRVDNGSFRIFTTVTLTVRGGL